MNVSLGNHSNARLPIFEMKSPSVNEHYHLETIISRW